MNASNICPSYDLPHTCDLYMENLSTEWMQCWDEGLDVEPLKPLMDSIAALKPSRQKAAMADALFELICELPVRADYSYQEPSDLPGIRALCDPTPALPPVQTDALYDKMHGAWIGRIAGCLLGKPVEGSSEERLRALLELTNNYPMNRYVMEKDYPADPAEREAAHLPKHALADKIPYAVSDDDTNYTVLGWLLIERYGRDFTPDNVIELWGNSQMRRAYFTAERAAFDNYFKGFRPPMTALYQNPYREWIGAQIRGDYFGYINPGDPAAAADMAWRDASISHIKNGIYGEMFASAMIAAAAVESDPEAVLKVGLSQIPRTSRLHEAIMKVIRDYHDGVTFEQFSAAFKVDYPYTSGHVGIHTVPNAVLVAAALLYGGGDFGTSICMAVQNGLDTDCNGATVGSVIGMICGASNIPAQWTEPLNGKLETEIASLGVVSITEMVDRTMKHLTK